MSDKEIKFRVWDLVFKEWLTGNYTTVQLDNSNTFELILAKDWVVQQYTGLKDKNCKEIYEGDILRIQVNGTILIYSTGTYVASVYWDDKRLSYELKILKEDCEKNCAKFNPTLCDDPYRVYEVIGNIYENKELL